MILKPTKLSGPSNLITLLLNYQLKTTIIEGERRLIDSEFFWQYVRDLEKVGCLEAFSHFTKAKLHVPESL